MVHESYVRDLEHKMEQAKRVLEQSPPSSGVPPRDPAGAETLDFAAPLSPPRTARAVKEEASGDYGSENFFDHLKKLSWTAAASSDDGKSTSPRSGAAETYTYSRLKFDFLREFMFTAWHTFVKAAQIMPRRTRSLLQTTPPAIRLPPSRSLRGRL